MYGYYPQPTKTWLIVKPSLREKAKQIFLDTDVMITTEGQKHLGAVIGTKQFKVKYIEEKIETWIKEIVTLSKIAKFAPQEAYTCFIRGYKHKLCYSMRTLPDLKFHLERLDDVITAEFIPSITGGGINVKAEERELFALPTSLGGLGIPIFHKQCDIEFKNSEMLTNKLCADIINQVSFDTTPDTNTQRKIKSQITAEKVKRNNDNQQRLFAEMSIEKRRLCEINSEKGSSIWLTTLPIKEEGYSLDKNTFWDLLKIRYGKELNHLPEICACGAKFNIQHALSCKNGGFVTLRHNILRDKTASLLTEVCKDVKIEPQLHTLTGETINTATNDSEEARLDVSARGFWVPGQKAFFDIRVFNPLARRYGNQNLKKAYDNNEKEKKRLYNERVLQCERGSFTPLVFSTHGGKGRECQKFYQRLASMVADKRKVDSSIVTKWINRKLSFALNLAIIMCIRGSRSLVVGSDNTNSNDAETSETLVQII